MRDVLVSEYHVPVSDIILEDKATNTLQNIPLSLNKIDSEQFPDSPKPKIGLLGADFHIPRIRILADLFGITDHKSFSAEQIFRTIAYKLEEKGDPQSRSEARTIQQQLDSLLSMNDDLSFPESRVEYHPDLKTFQNSVLESNKPKSTVKNATLFEIQTGKEAKGFREKRSLESFFTRGMVEVPEFWFGYIKFLNDDRLKAIVSKTNTDVLDRFGLKKETPIGEIRSILEPYTEGDKNKGGRRKMLEEFYIIENNTLAKAKVGEGLDKKALNAHDKLTRIAQRLNNLGNR